MSSFFKKFIIEKINEFQSLESKILEIGCGDYSIFEETKFQNVWALDISVDKIIDTPYSQVRYLAGDILNFESNILYDCIVDSHLLHCLNDKNEHLIALKNIYQHLNDDGLFISETMVQPASDKVFFPKRLILETIEIEKELIEVGFKLKYFLISSDLFFEEGSGLNKKCDLLRIVAQK